MSRSCVRQKCGACPESDANGAAAVKVGSEGPIDGRMIVSSVVADDLFALRSADYTESYFLVEIDRGQMPVRRNANVEEVVDGKRRLRTHYMHKLTTHWHGWKQGRPAQQFGVEELRVLTITTSTKRIGTMPDALREVTAGKGSERFLFIEDDTLSGAIRWTRCG
jgi:hypothetical protein